MSINKNTIWTVFSYLFVLTSPAFFALMPISGHMVINLAAGMYLLGAFVLFLINLKTNSQNTLSKEKSVVSQVVLYGLIGIIATIFLQNILVMVEATFFNQPLESANTEEIMKLIKSAPLFTVAVAIGGPIMEEFVFRYSLINFMNQKLNIWVAALISSLMFAAIHNDGHYLLYSGLGMFFFLLYKKTGSIYTSIIAHAGMNSLVVLVQIVVLK